MNNPASIDVNKKTVEELLSEGRDTPFVVPDYQRPYEWEEDQVNNLIDDIWTFSLEVEDEGKESYFLGTVVCAVTETGEQEIIDGQQRLTTLILLLRALYEKVKCVDANSGSDERKKCEKAKRRIEQAIWDVASLTDDVKMDNPHITSRVMSEEQRKSLNYILKEGKAQDKKKDPYSRNYRLIQKRIGELFGNQPSHFYSYINTVLGKCILMPIRANSQETALTIFSTLNVRGLQLTDADIFKAQIYGKLPNDRRSEFIDKWNSMTERCAAVGETMQRLFTYRMFYLKAYSGNTDISLQSLRAFYMDQKKKYLEQEDLMDSLQSILNLVRVYQINDNDGLQGEPWSRNPDIRKRLNIIASYPNEYWKYPVITYYLTHKGSAGFEKNFPKFLMGLIRILLKKYLISPTLGAVKQPIMRLNAAIIQNENPSFTDFNIGDEWRDKLITPHKNAVRMLLLLLAYNSDKQKELLPPDWEVEHIFPKKYDDHYFEDKDVVDEMIPHLGNLIPLGRKANIKASNGFFTRKQNLYKNSKIEITKELASRYTEWGVEQIRERDEELRDILLSILSQTE